MHEECLGGVVLVLHESLVCYYHGARAHLCRNNDLLIGRTNCKHHTDPRRALKVREKSRKVAGPDSPSGTLVNGVDDQQRARTGGLCSCLERADELLCGQARHVQLLKCLHPRRVIAHEPLAHKKHCWPTRSDALPRYVA